MLKIFVRALVVLYDAFVCHYLFFILPSFGTSGRLCFVIVAFVLCIYLYYLLT